ncbi:hypothetical protein NEOLEDRAFT_594157 [Neolentinus lepideus HHB14362 ss-1]|uniref:Uncharacterized protein n=1 Tax=Neolentinus lepideus HHB14362 ss-1 TaxID=1314782 RepID=A0A165V9F8_9AGAM|nr:hypothetical protein NEOLEDRAFT_594157 [Neolentinus lepideus HHB14362 ss-1]
MNARNSPSLPRYRHRKRTSASRLSSDSVAPLPAYTTPSAQLLWQEAEELPSDRPPDYPDSDADADTEDFESDQAYVRPPLSPPLTSPRRYTHRHSSSRSSRRHPASASDPYLDSLLERSVHALELSNTLLQSSMSTQSSLSTILAADSPIDRSLETRARALSSKIGGDVHEVWMDDLEQITKGVDKLFGDHAPSEEESEAGPSKTDDSATLVSYSLPSTSSIRRPGRGMRRPSLDLRTVIGDGASSDAGHLNYSNHNRSNLVASAPRALTLYVDSTDDPASILLPSTLGLRSSSSAYFREVSSGSTDITASSSRPRPSKPPSLSHSRTVSSDKLDRCIEASSSLSTMTAYDLLSSVAKRNASPPVVRRTSVSECLPSSSSSLSSSLSRRSSHSQVSAPKSRLTSPDPGRRRRSTSRSRSITPRRHYSPPPPHRPMTPPIEELSSASTNASTDSQPDVSRTLQTLRKILDDQPKPPDPHPPTLEPLRKANFLPKSPPPAPASGTSTATASISRLFTKGMHHSSTRPPSPPRHSSLKQRSAPPTPVSASPSLLGIPDSPLSRSSASSGRSTPKRISFAELPESYGSSKPGGSESSKYPSKRGKKKKNKERSDSEGSAGWWASWLLGANGTYGGAGMSMSVERAEERGVAEGAGRGWGGKVRLGFDQTKTKIFGYFRGSLIKARSRRASTALQISLVQSGRTYISLLHLARQKGAHVSIRYLSLLGFALVTTVYDLFIISLTYHRYHRLQSMDSCKLFTISSPRSLLHFPLAVCVITHCILLSQCHSLNCVTKRTDRLVFHDATRNAYLVDWYNILFMGEM